MEKGQVLFGGYNSSGVRPRPFRSQLVWPLVWSLGVVYPIDLRDAMRNHTSRRDASSARAPAPRLVHAYQWRRKGKAHFARGACSGGRPRVALLTRGFF